MRHLLIALFILLALPAEAARTLEVKHSESEALNMPQLAELRAKTEKAEAEAQSLRQQRDDLVRKNTAMTGEYTQAQRTAPLSKDGENPQETIKRLTEEMNASKGDAEKTAKLSKELKEAMAGINKRPQEYQEKFNQLNNDLRDVSPKVPDAEKKAAQLRRQLKFAVWEARIDNKEYRVYITDGMDWVQPDLEATPKRQPEKRLVLRDATGQKYLFDPPPADPKAPKCGIWPKDGEALAIWQIGTEPPPKERETPTLKASLGQVYFLEREETPKDCGYGTVTQKAAK